MTTKHGAFLRVGHKVVLLSGQLKGGKRMTQAATLACRVVGAEHDRGLAAVKTGSPQLQIGVQSWPISQAFGLRTTMRCQGMKRRTPISTTTAPIMSGPGSPYCVTE